MTRGRGAERGSSDIVAISLIAVFALLSSLLLVAGAWSVVGGLTTESTESLTLDSMYRLDEAIDEVSGASESTTVAVEFPEDSGESLEAAPEDGELNLTVTANATFWNRTVADAHGENRTGANVTVMGTVRQESDHHGTVAYQGGGLFQRPTPDAQTFVLSEPPLSVTGDSVDMGMVSLSDSRALTEGSQLTIRGDPTSGAGGDLQEFIAMYYTDRYNPAMTAPVRTNVTIESQYADGWATYAEKQLDHADTVIYPYEGNENKVRIVLGEIGDPPADTHNPTFGDDDILYAGSSDLAYLYHNDTAHGDIEEDHHDGPMSPNIESIPTDDEYRLALYNESGRWLVYNTSADRWETAHGEPADPANTAALNTSAGPANAVDDAAHQFFVDPPAWVAETPTTPICVVTNTSGISTAEMADYVDENGEDCLDTMVGVDEDLVGPVPQYPEFNVTMETTAGDLNETYTTGETVEVEVNVTNEGDATGQTPLGVYLINETNDPPTDGSDLTFVNGTAAADLELDPGEDVTKEYTFETAHPMTGQNWTVYSVLGGGLADNVTNATTGDTFFFEVVQPDAQLDIVEVTPSPDPVDAGDTQVVEVRINESKELISDPVTQYLTLRADGRLVNQTEITYASGENTTRQIAWEPTSSDAGSVDLNVSTYDDANTTSVTVVDTSPPPANFQVQITGTNSSIKEGQNLTVDVNVTNTGGQTATQDVVLDDMDGNPADSTSLTLNPGDSAYPTLEWRTVYGENGTGTVNVESEDDDDSAFVNVTAIATPNRDPVSVAFAIDETSSMTSNDPTGERINATKTAIDSLDASIGDEAAWVPYARHLCVHDNGTILDYYNNCGAGGNFTVGPNETEKRSHIAQSLTNNLAGLKSKLYTEPSGFTNLTAGYMGGVRAVENASGDKYVILLTDGNHTTGPIYPSWQHPDADMWTPPEWVSDPANSIPSDVTVYTVGFGSYTQSVLEDIATNGGTGEGEFYPASNASDLTDVFSDITDDITESDTPTFEVQSVTTPGTPPPASEGDTVTVEATINNTGAAGESVVSLVHGGTPVDTKLVDLNTGTPTTVTLQWDTTGVSTPPPQQTITVETGADSESQSVMVTPSAGPSGPQLDVTAITATPAPLTAGDSLTVEATIENTGGSDAINKTVTLDVAENGTGDTVHQDFNNTVSVAAGDTTTVPLSWDSAPGEDGSYDLEIETPDDTNTTTVNVQEPMTDLDVSILNADDPIQAGGALDVFVEVENTGGDTENGTVVLRDDRTDQMVDMAVDVSVSGGATVTETLTWETRIGQGDETPVPIRAEIANTGESATAQVELREAETNLDDASMASGSDPVDINLDEIQLG